MSDTREQILLTALRLFARDGYEAVSVSAIAGALGMTKGALYRHYKNKRHIFDSIVERMYRIDAERSRRHGMPEQTYDVSPEAYEDPAAENILRFTLDQFTFWTTDPFAADFRKMLALEQYRNEEMAKLYSSCITAGPVAYMEDIFRAMMRRGTLRGGDPRLLAVEFYAPLHLLISMADAPEPGELPGLLLVRHVERFLHDNAARPEEKEETT